MTRCAISSNGVAGASTTTDGLHGRLAGPKLWPAHNPEGAELAELASPAPTLYLQPERNFLAERACNRGSSYTILDTGTTWLRGTTTPGGTSTRSMPENDGKISRKRLGRVTGCWQGRYTYASTTCVRIRMRSIPAPPGN